MAAKRIRLNLAARLANTLRRERKLRNWTQEYAAERAGVNSRHYQKLEEGSVNATLETLERLCRAFDLDAPALFEA